MVELTWRQAPLQEMRAQMYSLQGHCFSGLETLRKQFKEYEDSASSARSTILFFSSRIHSEYCYVQYQRKSHSRPILAFSIFTYSPIRDERGDILRANFCT